MARRKARKPAADRQARRPSASFSADELRDREATSNQEACLAVYDGANRVGSIVERDGQFQAFDAHDRRVGTFGNQRDAMRAIPRARP